MTPETRILTIAEWRARQCRRDDYPPHDPPKAREPEWLRRRRTIGLPAKDYSLTVRAGA